MPIISFANSKGGAGKTTAATLLAPELARRGRTVSVIDADPQRWISRWCDAAPKMPGMRHVSYVSLSSLQRHVEAEAARSEFVVVDLPGTSNELTPNAVTLSDYVVIPVQGCAMDAQGGAQILDLLDYLHRKAGLAIAHSVVLSRVNPMVTTRALTTVKLLLAARGVHVIDTPITERSAFRDMYDHGVPLHLMDARRASKLDKALENAIAFTDDVLRRCDRVLAGRTDAKAA